MNHDHCRVCKSWHKVSLDPSLWTVVDLTRQRITAHALSTTVQKQPPGLVLDWTNLGKQQLNWLLPRVPQTKTLSLVGLDFTLTVSSLNTCNCPLLQVMKLEMWLSTKPFILRQGKKNTNNLTN